MKIKLLVSLALGLPVLILLFGCSSQPSTSPPTSTLAPAPNSRNLVNGTITVGAGEYYNIKFTVDASMHDAQVSGSFKVQGDAVNNIEALVMDDAAFGEWTNVHKETNLYYSGKANSANISVTIPNTGDYHLVFDNSFSLLTPKQVLANVNVQWSAAGLR